MSKKINRRTGDSREKSVQHSLSSQQRVVGGQLLCDRSHLSDRPHLHHGELLLHPLKLQLHHHILTQTYTHTNREHKATSDSYFETRAAAGGEVSSHWHRSCRAEPRRSRCLCFWGVAWSCAWWGSSRTPCRRCLLLWCDCQPTEKKEGHIVKPADLMISIHQAQVCTHTHTHIPVGSCWAKTPTWGLGSGLRCLHLWGCRCSVSCRWCPSGVVGYHQRWTPWFLDPAPQRGASLSAAQGLPQTHQLCSRSGKSTHFGWKLHNSL